MQFNQIRAIFTPKPPKPPRKRESFYKE